MNLYLIAIYGLKAIKPKQTLVQPTGNCKELNSYLYIVIGFYTFQVGRARVLVNCGWPRLYIFRYHVYTNLVTFYTFDSDFYNCLIDFYTFERSFFLNLREFIHLRVQRWALQRLRCMFFFTNQGKMDTEVVVKLITGKIWVKFLWVFVSPNRFDGI